MNILRRAFIFILLSLLAAVGLHADAVKVGQRFPALTDMQDQHEQAYPWPADLRHVIVAYTMGSGKLANGYFADQKNAASFLPEHDALFIANVYGMPAVGRFFAMPKMKKYPHRIMLADAESLLDDFPQQEGRVTVFDLDAGGTITAIRFWDPDSEELTF